MSNPQPTDQINFYGDLLRVTAHAIERFMERFAEVYPRVPATKHPLKTIRKLINKSTRMEIDPKHRLMRLLNNHCEPAEYWIHVSGLRFVVIYDRQNEEKVLVTVEHARELTQEELITLCIHRRKEYNSA